MAPSKRKTSQQPTPQPELPGTKDFTEIGGSPVPGLTLRYVLRGHAKRINRIAWSPNGQYLASPSHDETIRIWDVGRGECVSILRDHADPAYTVAWLADGERVVSGSWDHKIVLWSINGTMIRMLSKQDRGINAIASSPNLPIFAVGTEGQVVAILNAETGEWIGRLIGHKGNINNLAWSPSGSMIAGASGDKTVRIWDATTYKLIQTCIGHSDWVFAAAWSLDEKSLFSCSWDRTIRQWDIQTGRQIAILEGHISNIESISGSSDGRLIASKSIDGIVKIWNPITSSEIATLPESSSSHFSPSLAFHPSLSVLATLGEEDTVVRIWDLDTDALLSGQITAPVKYTTAKLVLVGDSGVGKTGLGWRLAHGEFKEHASTHGQQFWSIPELGLKRRDGTECEAVLWDLAGQHVYRQIHSIFLENVVTALVLFDPSNRQDPLKGAEFWLEQLKGKGQLPPAVLVGARVDRGAPWLTQQELDQFCQRHGIKGGYISTSALNGEGLDELLEIVKAQIPWDEMTATVTTVTFKHIKDYVLALKEKPDRKGALVSPAQLRAQLQATDQDWQFTDAEMMTAVGHLETHGYVAVLRSSAGEQHILLTSDLLVTLASSIVLLADKNPRELGAISETELLQGKYQFGELTGLEKTEQQILLDAAVLRFLEHSICFRETLNSDTLLIFPGLIKQKRPLKDDIPATDDISYIVHGRVENLYPMLAVLLGYTPSFTRINQWQNQAQYELGPDEICGFRMIEEREGEIELVLYYGDKMPKDGHTKFEELFEQFLYQREVDVTRIPPVLCPSGHRQERATVIKRAREGKRFVHCEECGKQTDLPHLDQPQTIGIGAAPWLQREEATARLRSAYEMHLTSVKSYRRGWAMPRAYVSRMPERAAWADKLIHDLRDAGVYIVEPIAQVKSDDFVILLDTLAYQKAYSTSAQMLADDIQLIRARLSRRDKRNLVSLRLEGRCAAHELKDCIPGGFCDETHYPVSLFDLVLNLYVIPLTHAGFAPLRRALHEQWEQLAERLGRVEELTAPHFERPVMNYQDFQVLVTAAREIRASSAQGDEWGELRLDMSRIKLALSLIEKRQTDADLLKNLGGELHQALFPNKVHGHWRATKAGAEAAGSSVRLRLIFEAPELAALPWELLYDESTNTFLANDTQTAFSRYIDVPLSKRDLANASRPLKILLVISGPTNLPKLDAAGEEALIREALAAHIAAGNIELDVVREATIRNLTQQLRVKQYDVLHFIGHGDFENNRGVMALVDAGGKARWLDEEAFANLFLGNRSLGLIILNSCKGASSSSYRAMAGVAPNLVRRGLPAVVAMQYSILDSTAKQFADEFYRTLALGWPVDAAVQTTRNAISIEVGLDQPDFATPVLYMRAKDGVILNGL